MEYECVAILDAGSQFCKLIDRRIREHFVCTVILPLNVSLVELLSYNVRGIVISGGPGNVYAKNLSSCDPGVFELGIPILGICFGMQLITSHFGGNVEEGITRQDGQVTISLSNKSLLYSNMDGEQTVLLTHGDNCITAPESFKIDAFISESAIASIYNDEKKIYGVQYHPEVDLTINGKDIFGNFLTKICNCSQNFLIEDRISICINEIKKQVGNDQKVVVLVSGGVDSTVCAALLFSAIGTERVIPLHIDHGFLRKDESEKILAVLKNIGMDVQFVDCAYEYLISRTFIPKCELDLNYLGPSNIREESSPLMSILHPEIKRKIIGDTFVKVFNKKVSDWNLPFGSYLLAQGTLRPDLIESASSIICHGAQVIKTHHNDTEMVRELRKKGLILEPLKDFHKDEVREIGMKLGLPYETVNRHPFPGPGLAIRVICAETPIVVPDQSCFDVAGLAKVVVNYGKYLKEGLGSIKIVANSLSPSDLVKLEQATMNSSFNVSLLPLQSVGIQGDGRTYKNIIALSTDDPDPNWKHMSIIASVIPKICVTINRVVFALGRKIENPILSVTCTKLGPHVLDLARTADHIVSEVFQKYNDFRNVSQVPVILIPIHFDLLPVGLDPSIKRSIVIRPFISRDFMTGIAAIPNEHISVQTVLEINQRIIQEMPEISRVLYDLTTKPPGTTEWE